MNEVWESLWPMALALIVSLIGPVIGMSLVVAQRRWTRSRRRSPLSIQMLRPPGHGLKEKIEEAVAEILTSITLLTYLPTLLLVLYLLSWIRRGYERTAHLQSFFVLFGLLLVGTFLVSLWRIMRRLENLRAGYDAELAVGQALDQLMRQGAHVFHDLPGEGFNIDHVVVASQGIFAVETKGYTKRKTGDTKGSHKVGFDGKTLSFPAWSTREPLEQAQRQAKWLADWLTRSTGEPMGVLPVLALPGWFVQRNGRGDVRVYSGAELKDLLDARGATRLDAASMQRAVHQLDQRCRTIAPGFARAVSK